MSLKKRLFSLALIFSLLLTGCSNSSIPTNADTAFRNFTLALFKQDVSSTTLGLHYTLENPELYGISSHNVTYGTFATEAAETKVILENYRAVLNEFPYDALSDENQLTYDVLSSYISTAMQGSDYILYEEPLSPITGIHAQLPVLLAEYEFHSESDVQTYLALLKTTPDYFDSLIHFEQCKSEAGLFMADYIVDEVLAQCNAFLAMGEENYLLSTFEERLAKIPTLSNNALENYLAQNRQLLETTVLPAYEELVHALSELKGSGKNELGLCYLPGGKEYYSYLIARDTGSGRSIEEIKSFMQAQVAEDALALQTLLTATTLPDKADTLADSATPESILTQLEQQIAGAFPLPKDVSIEVKYVPDALQPYLSPAFYLIPSIDNATQNVIYINQAHTLENIHLFTTLAHEGYPGHLYQTTYYSSQNPDPLRQLFSFKGYVEGWATYAEMCSYSLSSLDKSYASMLQKNSSLILGLYALADFGIHYEGWNLERTIQFFRTYGIEDSAAVQEIYELIIGDPGNYISYYLGYAEILELKRDMIKKEGQDFSQKEFHKKLLDVGPAPFDIVRKYVLGT